MYPKRSREQTVMCSLFSLPVSLPFPQQSLSNSLCSSNLLYQIVMKLVMLLNVLWQRGMRILYYTEFHFPNTYHILMHPFSECLLSTCSIPECLFSPTTLFQLLCLWVSQSSSHPFLWEANSLLLLLDPPPKLSVSLFPYAGNNSTLPQPSTPIIIICFQHENVYRKMICAHQIHVSPDVRSLSP